MYEYDTETGYGQHARAEEREDEARMVRELEDAPDVARVVDIDEERRFHALDAQLSTNLASLATMKFITLFEKKEVA